MKVEHRVKLPRWDKFAKDALGECAFIYVKGGNPNKIFRTVTHKGANVAMKLLLKLHVTNWILFSVQEQPRSVALMATAMLLRDLGDENVTLYVENGAGGPDGVFPDMMNPDRDEIKAFYKEIRTLGKRT